jgi:hypothetical protein
MFCLIFGSSNKNKFFVPTYAKASVSKLGCLPAGTLVKAGGLNAGR